MIDIKSCTTCDKCKEAYHAERLAKEAARFETLKLLYKSFSLALDAETVRSIRIDGGLLYLVVRSYFDDIYRFKDYTGSKLADQHKQAAYTIKWISKLRPIQIISDSRYTEEMIWINSSFSLYAGLSFLHVPNIFEHVSKSLYETLMYATQYRYISGRQLSALLYSIEQSACIANVSRQIIE